MLILRTEKNGEMLYMDIFIFSIPYSLECALDTFIAISFAIFSLLSAKSVLWNLITCVKRPIDGHNIS